MLEPGWMKVSGLQLEYFSEQQGLLKIADRAPWAITCTKKHWSLMSRTHFNSECGLVTPMKVL